MTKMRVGMARQIAVLVAAPTVTAVVLSGWLSASLTTSLVDSRARSVGLVLARSVAKDAGVRDYDAAAALLRAAKGDPSVLEATLWDKNGYVVASTERRRVGLLATGDVLRTVWADQPMLLSRRIGRVGVIESWTPVLVVRDRAGVLSVAFGRAELDQRLGAIWLTVAAVVAVGLAAAWLMARLVGGRSASRVVGIAEVARRLADGDLTVRVERDPRAEEEIADLYGDVEKLIVQLRALIEEAQAAGGQLQRAADEILGRAEDEASSAAEQASSLAETSATLEELRATIKSISAQAKAVSELATSVQLSVESGQQATRLARESMEAIRAGSQESAKQAEELQEASRRISYVVGVINEIARRTKILAVNAAIEAARAQGLGAGFNVVAMEVRQLADSVVESTSEIEQTMSEFSGAIEGIVRATDSQDERVQEGAVQIEEADEVMRGIELLARQAANAAQEISFGTQQQEQGSEQVVTAVREVANSAAQVAESGRSNREAAQALAGLTDRLSAIVARFRV